jgi:type IV secretory pathway component VirB8
MSSMVGIILVVIIVVVGVAVMIGSVAVCVVPNKQSKKFMISKRQNKAWFEIIRLKKGLSLLIAVANCT